ncbi:glycosyl hydrolases family 2, TIM barrel domain-containing protein [Hyaloraphidium curvatum]|nr:glycosyl hydrolases family 2, TIM barrel domain-containing protein [Hyaloraphidium curvatum]
MSVFAAPGRAYKMLEERLAEKYLRPIPDGSPDHADPRVVGRKRRPGHAPMRAFPDANAARAFWAKFAANPTKLARECTPNVLMLTGEAGEPAPGWKFLLVGDLKDAPKGWNAPGFDEAAAKVQAEGLPPDSFAPIMLPSHWQLPTSGLPAATRDIPIYTNTTYACEKNPPVAARTGKFTFEANDRGVMQYRPWMDKDFVPRDPRERGPYPTGLYRRTIALPDRWKADDQRVVLVFEGVDSCVKAYVDGKFAGFSKDPALPCEFDVTDLLDRSATEHVIAAEVMRYCDGSYIEDQDKWNISGIYREAYLVKKPKAAIADYRTKASLGEGTISFEVLCEGVAGTKAGHFVRVEVYEGADGGSGAPVATAMAAADGGISSPELEAAHKIWDPASEPEFAPFDKPAAARATIAVANAKPWTPETPNLYTAVISLHASKADAESGASPLDVESVRTGFVDIKITAAPNSLVTVNGSPITICGVNRPEFHATMGRGIPLSVMASDAMLLKRLNFNGIRTAHYPSSQLMGDICDQAGLYMVDEGDLETHGFQISGQPAGTLSDSPDWTAAYVSRCARMWMRDSNHPCIFAWSVGNESGMGRNTQAAADWLRARDGGRRPVQYESGGVLNDATDIIVPMYFRPEQCLGSVAEDPKGRPLILCEYAHAMGNSGGCLAGYWRRFRDRLNTRMQGGFIWDMVDQGILMDPALPNLPASFPKDRPAYGYGGDFGDIPNSAQFCINGILAPDRTPHPQALEAAAQQCPVGLAVKDGQLVVTNRFDFSPLAAVSIRARVGCDAAAEAGGEWVTVKGLEGVAPQKEQALKLADVLPGFAAAAGGDAAALAKLLGNKLEAATEAWIEVTVENAAGTHFLPKGTEILRASFDAPELAAGLATSKGKMANGIAAASGAPAPFDVPKGDLAVKMADGSSAVVGVKCGRLLSWKSPDGKELLAEPVDIGIERASTDNDYGGGPFSISARWKSMGLGSMERRPAGKDGTAIVAHAADGKRTTVETLFEMVAPKGAALAGAVILAHVRYEFEANGDIRLCSTIAPPGSLPPLPRVGFKFAVPRSAAAKVRWSGLGPYEAYPDRVACVRKGIWESTPEKLFEPYVFPGECGWRAGARWVALSGVGGSIGIACAARDGKLRDGYGFSALPFPWQAVDKALHDWELKPDPEKVYVHVDSRMMGCGGHDAWSPNVDPEYVLPQGADFVTEVVLSRGGEAGAKAAWAQTVLGH